MPSRYPPRPGRCVHCLKDNVQLTWDHLFPKAWYPDSTRPNIEKWQIPACLRCNQQYGKLEDELLLRLGMCVNPTLAQASGIADKVLRAMDPSSAKNAKDAAHRHRRRMKMRSLLTPVSSLPSSAIIPAFPRQLDWPEATHGIQIPGAMLRALAEKLTRGIYYLDGGRFIEPPFTIDFYLLREAPHDEVRELLEKHGTVYAREPGIVVKRAIAEDDRMHAILGIEIWGQFRMFTDVSASNEGGADLI